MSEWKDFTSEVEESSKKKGSGCTVGIFLRKLDKMSRIQVENALSRPELTTSAISRALRNRGSELSDFTVRRHRRGDCSCSQDGK